MRALLFPLILCAFFIACGDDDSGPFLVRGDTASYSSEDADDFSSSSAQFSSSSEHRSSSSSEQRVSSSSMRSSSSVLSSSSVNPSSSSKRNVALVEPLRQNSDEDCDYGSLTDKRDGQVYKTVVIGEQTWMAENLNYAYLQPDSLGTFDSASLCYNDSLEYCDKYGRLYSFDVIEKVCPDGWHLPSMEEWEVLFDAVGGIDFASEKLISSYGWKNQRAVDDGYCFSVLPGGYLPSDFRDLGVGEGLWTSTWYDSDDVKNVYFYNNYSYAYEGYTSFEKMLYIRCLKD